MNTLRNWFHGKGFGPFRVVGRAIPEVGGGWVCRRAFDSKELKTLAKEGWALIPSGRYTTIIQHPNACYCAPNAPHLGRTKTETL